MSLAQSDELRPEDLNSEQRRALELALQGENFFLTGSGGTGKSFCVEYIVHALRKRGKNVALTSTSGISAVTVGGVTVHSFGGFQLGNQTPDELRRMAKNSQKYAKIWRIDTLIIDEISMLHPDYFEKLGLMAQCAREDASAFGGVQVILVGDFFQLPPVHQRVKGRVQGQFEFCFETPTWEKTIPFTIELKQVFRQTDPPFVELLQRVRWSRPSYLDLRVLSSRLNAKVNIGEIQPTALHANVAAVNARNEAHLQSLPGAMETYRCMTGWNHPSSEPAESLPSVSRIDHVLADMKKHPPADDVLHLKIGAQVILLVNLSPQHGLMNGSRGIVVAFSEPVPPVHPPPPDAASPRQALVYPIVRFAKVQCKVRPYMWKHIFGGRHQVYAYLAQIPLKLASAYTIHRSQSQSLDCVSVQLDKTVFEYGQAYTALSRVRSLEGLSLSAFDPSCIRAHPKVVEFYAKMGLSEVPSKLEVLMKKVKSATDLDNTQQDTSEEEEIEEVEEAEEEEDEDEEQDDQDDEEDGEDETEEDEAADEKGQVSRGKKRGRADS